MRLYHFTCGHSAEEIKRSRWLRPNPQPQLDGRELVWLTDLESPSRDQLGLTSVALACDRMEYRVVAVTDAERWVDYARHMPTSVRLLARSLNLQATAPMHWFVSELPVPVLGLERVP